MYFFLFVNACFVMIKIAATFIRKAAGFLNCEKSEDFSALAQLLPMDGAVPTILKFLSFLEEQFC